MLTVTSRKLVPALINPGPDAAVRVYRYRHQGELRYGYCFGRRAEDLDDIQDHPAISEPTLLYVDGFETAAGFKLRTSGELDGENLRGRSL